MTSICFLGTNEVDDFTNQWISEFQVMEVYKAIWNSVPIIKKFPWNQSLEVMGFVQLGEVVTQDSDW